ncbi:MAG: hypothetical protein HUU15_14385, partial [Candidatus Brocadiae bacterium]|nr:hypothetical protein [Candidatus Brocadiia bacterium]
VAADLGAARAWGERGRELCRGRFAAARMVAALEDLYRPLVPGGGV